MSTITISRQLGSLSCEVAGAIRDRLGFRLVWRELINQAAVRAGAPEVALSLIDELDLLGLRPAPGQFTAYRKAAEQVMNELADEGNVVILGRAGQVVLRGRPDVLHVRLTAPMHVRIERLVSRQSITPEKALAQLEASDRSRANYLKRFYKVHWDDPHLYDLIVNTAYLGPTAAARLICEALNLRIQPKAGEDQASQESLNECE